MGTWFVSLTLEVMYQYKLSTSTNALYMTHWLFLPVNILPGWMLVLSMPSLVIACLHQNILKADQIEMMLPSLLLWQESVRELTMLILSAIVNMPNVLTEFVANTLALLGQILEFISESSARGYSNISDWLDNLVELLIEESLKLLGLFGSMGPVSTNIVEGWLWRAAVVLL